jgi:hypothetical protein
MTPVPIQPILVFPGAIVGTAIGIVLQCEWFARRNQAFAKSRASDTGLQPPSISHDFLEVTRANAIGMAPD